MKKVLMTNMSSKGQVVIPNEFRKSLGLIAGTPLAVYTDGNTLLLKPVEVPEADAFEKLLKESRTAAKAAGLKRSEVSKAIKKVRSESRS
ncbi:MAG: AbrB/MazE/SpoVT family DNA-binding domain-containing protein [Deltaproteobacteria bacterium]|nr:AbrB/MazE/SpoVT family DNA-binding domain-containing protein [Deltaproteobacteria bacterium]MBI3293256.1 AbrB/MazE/SpoVT family DNA-binding domain-containing protein [Deltaproteobacteria bacterium]